MRSSLVSTRAGSEAAGGVPAISQPVETGGGTTTPLSENYANALRIAELLTEMIYEALLNIHLLVLTELLGGVVCPAPRAQE
jgi:hypothetical protein